MIFGYSTSEQRNRKTKDQANVAKKEEERKKHQKDWHLEKVLI
jgi:hypothetical protein